MTINYQKVSLGLLASLDERTRDVLIRRFGLQEEEPQTLEAIGQNFGVTRERVRQIEAAGIRHLQELLAQGKRGQEIFQVFKAAADHLAKAGGFKREDLFLQELVQGEALHEHHAHFLLLLCDEISREKESDVFYPFWTKKKDAAAFIPAMLKKLKNFLTSLGKPVQFNELQRALQERILLSHLEVAKDIEQTFEGAWGLVEWPEVKPRGVRDRAYIVLKHQHRPLHFREVAELIDKLGLQKKQQPTLVQTVHNELIKDKRFVLVGRGTYALAEWGALPGTVKDVIVSILKAKGQPMTKDDIIKEVLNLRQVQAGTVLLNLQDRRLFPKDESNRYSYRTKA